MSGSKQLLLDTNVVIGIFKGQLNFRPLIEKEFDLAIPAVVLGELYYGCFNSSNLKKHLEQIDAFIKEVTVLNTNNQVCLAYGGLKAVLKKNGTPIPENDIWIAAFSQAYAITLFSLDKHFDIIPDFDFIKSV